MKNNGPDYEPATIEIGEVYFNKHGMLFFDGLVENDYVKVELEDMAKILPKIEGEYIDQDGLYNAVMDSHFNLHWQIKVSGQVLTDRVYLVPIIEQLLLEAYQKSR